MYNTRQDFIASSKTNVPDFQLTPERGLILNEMNTHNRPKSDATTARYAADIKAGNWRTNGETIKVSNTGVILDGQKRIQAVLDTGITIITDLVLGLPDETFDTIDIGQPRTVADLAVLGGLVDSEHRTGLQGAMALLAYIGLHDLGKNVSASPKARIEYVRKHPEIVQTWLPVASEMRKDPLRLPPGIGIALGFLAGLVDPTKAVEFLQAIPEGSGLAAGDPRKTFRDYVLRNSADLDRRETLRRGLRAFVAFKENEKCHKLQPLSISEIRNLYPAPAEI